ncbi:hypothetical protein MJO29_012690 [Puccinia striiformis f. sp. tritici]|uniref:Uncharacterized protein n=1 Tax=Puccinia striiformis f. sp. tritici PST-78 TaxID=1165861 RepID=A0A0L0UUS9_9BASI|nr:hypothetical protein Pst134EA_024150 [Puccinia striiformis f. sp. tritici]KAH9444572.1 hypothetical protein Pst134EB_024834 [Puccinia striiformis f. sp. tritici]KAH9453266.1 hypothetical protein Pst134EA_024150 [Puccinia striiformis f. sp. tritici]KAI7942846.1 hypothetical protein MJO29_012690 [Puccinia striiformis f. sp. tritici]KNE90802.1 hypothetical protein PSTG_15768 [Puccinia striiformis f. sp. tritici PST-78]
MAAKAKAAAAKRAAAAKKSTPASTTKTIPLAQHDPTRPPPMKLNDQTVFKQILHLYELKQYSAALQLSDDLLGKYPGHGETTAMAGLLHHSMNNKAQGYSLVKAGMKADLKSHIVWHVYGIITRADRNYTEAVKSYTQALRLDPDNHNILRDLAVLQIQVRQYSAYVESRWKLLRSNRRSRTAWFSLAMAYKLNHQSEAALEILNAMETHEVIHEPEISFERSESILFKTELLPASEALEYLENSCKLVLDRPRYILARAQHLAELGRVEAAEWAWFDLLDTNSENRMYLEGYLANRSKVQNENPFDALKRLTDRYPSSQLIKRMILDHAIGTQFEHELETYLCLRLTKGIPSLFNDIKPLLIDPIKLKTVRDVAERLHEEVSKNGYFELTKDTENQQPSSTLVWILHFLSQLYGSSYLNMTKESIEAAEQAIAHTPSLPDIYISLAHAYKRAGSYQKAADALRSARGLDGQDRFLNSKCAKYVLQSIGSPHQTIELGTQLLQESRDLIAMFTRKDAPDPVSDLVDMQATWYVLAEAEVALRVSDWGLALKRLHQVYEIFRQWEEDQYDFHTYCIRKNTFQTYQDLLKFEDTLYADPIFYKAVSKAIKIYMTIDDRMKKAKEAGEEVLSQITEFNVLVVPQVDQVTSASGAANLDSNGLAPDPTEDASNTKSKKSIKKAKMAEIKAKAQAALDAKKASSKNKNSEQANSTVPEVIPPIVDDDPTGEKLLKNENPLEMANELLKPIEDDLARFSAKSIVDPTKRSIWHGVYLCRFEIELRRDKPLLALRALLKAHELSPDHTSIDPSVYVALTKLKVKYLSVPSDQLNGSSTKTDTGTTESTTPIRDVIQKALEKIELLELPNSYRGRLARAESLIFQRDTLSSTTDTETQISIQQIEAEIFSLFSSDQGLENSTDWKTGLKGLRLLESFESLRTLEFKSKAAEFWKFSDYFELGTTALATSSETSENVNGIKVNHEVPSHKSTQSGTLDHSNDLDNHIHEIRDF